LNAPSALQARRVPAAGRGRGRPRPAQRAARRGTRGRSGGTGPGGADAPPPPPPPPCTKWTRRVANAVLIGHAASLSQVLMGEEEQAASRLIRSSENVGDGFAP